MLVQEAAYTGDEMKNMTADFGTLTATVLEHLDYAESELTGDERHDTHKALQTYKAAVITALREAFDTEESPEPVRPVCATCGAPVEREHRFCGACRMPLTREAAAASLVKLFAKQTDRSPRDPLFRAALASIQEEEPEAWNALIVKLIPPAKA